MPQRATAAVITCPLCGNTLSDVVSFDGRALGGTGVEIIDAGRCRRCSLSLQRQRGSDTFEWEPICRRCYGVMASVAADERSATVLYRCLKHPDETWTYKRDEMRALR
jgi:hypothetical protein